MRNVLVTGGAGYIGSLLDSLYDRVKGAWDGRFDTAVKFV
jgi:hypothetical protein